MPETARDAQSLAEFLRFLQMLVGFREDRLPADAEDSEVAELRCEMHRLGQPEAI